MKKAVVVGQPQYKTGVDVLIPNRQPNTTDAGTNLNVTASSENRSKKFEYPQVSQDVPSEGRNQYE